MAVAFPSGLPTSPLRGTWSTAPVKNYNDFGPDQGLTIRRRKGRFKSQNESAAFVYTEAEKLILENWYENELRGGALSFTFPDFHTKVLATYQWADDGPAFSNLSTGFYNLQIKWIKIA